jgi:LuxR family transcriptional regulator, maltose regulon positive regulatory protein
MSLAVKSGRALSQDGAILRRDLLAQLRREHGAQVVLLVAPAGYGKTSFLAQWAESPELAGEGVQSTWVALEPWHDNPLALMREIVCALGSVEPFTPDLQAELDRIGEPEAAMRRLPALAAALEARTRPTLLILDDLQSLRSTTALQVVATVAEHLPDGTRLALASRSRPDLPLGRLRAHRALVELGARDLAMSAPEANTVLKRVGVKIDGEGMSQLMGRCEGWPAALYLAALSLREEPGQTGAPVAFSGGDEVVAEFLRDEFLRHLSGAELELLVHSSVCEVLCAPLCDALLAGPSAASTSPAPHTPGDRPGLRQGSARLLERLARGPLPFEAVDRAHERYRCHPLLRDALLAELGRAGPEPLALAHARARAWYAAHGDTDAAIAHAIAAGDARAAGELMWEHLPDYIPVGRNDVLQAHLRALSEEQIAATPTLALSAAHSALSLGELRRAERYALAGAAALAHAPARSKPSSLRAGIAAIEAAVARDGLAPMACEAAKAHEAEDEHSPWQPTFSLLLGVSAHLTGDRALAREHLREGARRGAVASPSIEMLCLTQLALVSAEENDVEGAVEEVGEAAAQMRRHSLCAYPIAALTYAVRADLLARVGHVDEAKGEAAHAARLLVRLDDFIPWYGAETRISLSRAYARLGEVALARALLAQASRLARRVGDATVLAGWLEHGWELVDSAACTRLSGSSALTIAELRVLRFLPSHLSFPEVGARLQVSTNTIKTQAHAVYRKLDVSSRSQAVARAREIGLLEP